MKIAVIYARYSSSSQSEQSIEGQLHVCYDYAKANNITILKEYIDRATTGTNDNRDAFKNLLKDCTTNDWDYVLVYKLDRFSRNKYEMAIHRKTLKDNGVKLISAMENIPDSPEGIILESLLEGMAEYYSAELSQKVKRGLKESRIKGNFTGGNVPYGFKITGDKISGRKVIIDENESLIVKYIFEQYAFGITIKEIINNLTKKGITRNGKPFPKNSILHILHNERYNGKFSKDGIEYTHTFPKIIPDILFKLGHIFKEEHKKKTFFEIDVPYLNKLEESQNYILDVFSNIFPEIDMKIVFNSLFINKEIIDKYLIQSKKTDNKNEFIELLQYINFINIHELEI